MSTPESGNLPRGESVLKLVFTLVHGTFAEREGWVNGKNPKFRNRLKAALTPHVVEFDDSFDWGGANKHRARQKGGNDLANHLKKQFEKTEGSSTKHFIVSHSHGGNVALYALRDKKLRGRIEGLVCMATPFLCPRHRVLPRDLLVVSIIGMIFSAFGIDFATSLGRWLYIAFVAVFVLLALVVLGFHLKFGDEPPKRLKELSLAKIRPDRLLVIRPSGDEASGLLRASQFLTWVLSRIWGLLTSILSFLFAFVLLSIFARTLISQLPGMEDPVNRFNEVYGAWLDPSVSIFIVPAVAVIFLMILARLAFGWDAIGWIANVETMAEDSPPGMARVILLPPHVQKRWSLAHTQIYNREETVEWISHWVKEITGGAKKSTKQDC